LLKTGADVTVISPEITRKIEKEKQRAGLKHIRRLYRKGDLKNAFLVIAATDSPSVNDKVSKDASCLINVVDTPHLCNFIVPSVIKRGPLTIAISTSGVSPGLSRSIRKELEKSFSPEFSDYLKSLKVIRSEAIKTIKDKRQREDFLKALGSEKIIQMLREKGFKKTKKLASDLFRKMRAT
jgi:precorrin-2 dehydrogenase/sirohydrochlorin ferrochelatase